MADRGMSLGGIYVQMRDWFQGSTQKVTDFSPGSVSRTLFETVAVPIEELFYRLYVTLPQRYFLSKAEDDADVDDLAADHTFANISRASEQTATGAIVITGTPGTVIPAGTAVIGQDNNFRYTTDAQGIIGAAVLPAVNGTIQIAATSQGAGSAGNLQPGRPVILVGQIGGVISIAVGPDGIGGGADKESNAALKKRIQGWFGTIQTGTPVAITRQALGVTGVKRAFFKGGVPQPGWWTCYIDDGSGGASLALRQAVYDALKPHVDAEILHVVQAGAVISVNMEVTLVTSSVDGATLTTIRIAAEKAVLAYFDTLGYEDSVFNDRVVVAVDSADERILSVTVKFTGPINYQAEQLIQVLYEDAATGRMEMRNPLRGTLFRVGTITWK